MFSRIQSSSGSKTNPEHDLTAQLSHTFPSRAHHDAVKVQRSRGHDELTISFHRTVRVADDDSSSALPPGLGTFPLYSVADYKNSLPGYMSDKGGILFPMYQREAMWINLQSKGPFAVKIYTGGVNAISGEPVMETELTAMRHLKLVNQQKSVQDYLVTPKQLWLDGIADSNGGVRQFVAMPIGSGYSVEAQVTGEECVRGLQFEIIPRIVPKPKTGATSAPRCGKTMQIWVRVLTGKSISIATHPEATVMSIKETVECREGVPTHQQRLVFQGKQLEDGKSLSRYSVEDGCTLHLVLRLKGGWCPSDEQIEMGIAAGGRIKQAILRDDYPATTWDIPRTILFCVQVLNSEAFKRFTGLPPPSTPISASTYAAQGLPYFEIFNEQPSGVRGFFYKLKSVNELDKTSEQAAGKTRLASEVNRSHTNPIIQLYADGTRRAFRPVSELEAELKALQSMHK